jgi:hypothetical protein
MSGVDRPIVTSKGGSGADSLLVARPMKYRFAFITGAAVGYVLGTRAGKERYEQIKRLSRRVAENPTVQEAAGVLRAQAGELAGTARQRVGDQMDKVQEKVPGIRRDRNHAADTS